MHSVLVIRTQHISNEANFLYKSSKTTQENLQIFRLLVTAFQLSYHQNFSLSRALKIFPLYVGLRAQCRIVYVIKTYKLKFTLEQATKDQRGVKL